MILFDFFLILYYLTSFRVVFCCKDNIYVYKIETMFIKLLEAEEMERT